MLTRNNIAYDLNISPHKINMVYEKHNITYVFSSELYVKKFFEKVENNRNNINESLSNRFGFNILNELLCDIKLYITIEKRGFLMFIDGEKVTCLNDITLDGQKLMIRKSNE